jgi:hypothetical protein
MSFFSSIGNWLGKETSQLGHWLSNPMHDLEALGGAAAIALPFLAPEILGGLGAGIGALGATDLGAGIAGAGTAIGSTEADIAAALGLGGSAAGTGIGGAAAGSLDAAGLAAGAGLPTELVGEGAPAALAGGGTGFDALAGASSDVLGASASAAPSTAGLDAFTTDALASATGAGGAGAPLDLTASAAGAVPGTAGGGSSWLGPLGGLFKGVTPLQGLQLGAGAAGIGMSLLDRMRGLPYQNQLLQGAGQAQATATQDLGLAQTYGQPLATGVLPAPWQAAVTNAEKQAEDTIRSKYAGMNLSGSSSEAGELAALQARVPEIQMQIAQGMAQIGVSYSSQALAALGLSDNIYTALMDANIKQDQTLANALAGFAGAAARGQGAKA